MLGADVGTDAKVDHQGILGLGVVDLETTKYIVTTASGGVEVAGHGLQLRTKVWKGEVLLGDLRGITILLVALPGLEGRVDLTLISLREGDDALGRHDDQGK